MQNKFSNEQLTDIIQWDIHSWKKALFFWDKHVKITPGMKVLALGEREGGLSLFFALKGCEVVCSDYNSFPDETKQLHKKYQVSEKITYAQADMRNLQFQNETFDIVVFKSVIGALGNKDDQTKAVAEIFRVLKSSGTFLFAENSTASKLHQRLRKSFVKWAADWRYISDNEFKAWEANTSKAITKKAGFMALFGRREWQRQFLSYSDAAIAWLIPNSWKYIYIGVLVKK